MSDIQVYVSYARVDDEPDPSGSDGFVTAICRDLTRALEARGPAAPGLWLDGARRFAAERFDEAVASAIHASHLVLIVLSPGWLASELCRRELRLLGERFGEHGLAARAVLLGLAPVDKAQLPEPLRNVRMERFFADADGRQEVADRFTPVDPRWQEGIGRLADHLYRLATRTAAGPVQLISGELPADDAAWLSALDEHLERGPHPGLDVAEMVRLAAEAIPPASPHAAEAMRPAPLEPAATVFVARPADGMRDDYHRLVDALAARGFAVVPDPATGLPADAAAASAEIDAALARADLSIHLVDAAPGAAPDAVAHAGRDQFLRAGRRARLKQTPGFSRLMWAPSSLYDPSGSVPPADPWELARRLGAPLPSDRVEAGSVHRVIEAVMALLDRDVTSRPRPRPRDVPAPEEAPRRPPGHAPLPGARDTPPPPRDNADVSAFAPAEARAGARTLVQVFLHRHADADAARAQAREADAAATRRGIATLDVALPLGSRVDVLIEADGAAVDAPAQSLVWTGAPCAVQAWLAVPPRAAGRTVAVSVHVVANGRPAGSLRFALPVVGKPRAGARPRRRVDAARRYDYAFLSYSRRDEAKVWECVQLMRGIGQDHFHDVSSLPLAQEWCPAVRDALDRCDLFLLFLTEHAARSAEVRKETDYAFGRRTREREPFIWFLFLEPHVAELPDWLKGWHADSELRRAQLMVDANKRTAKAGNGDGAARPTG